MGVKANIKSLNPNGFKNVVKSYEKQLRIILNTSGNMVKNTAVQSILSGGGGGRTYELYNPRRTHTASAEGHTRKSDTGFLANHIAVNLDKQNLAVDVESKADYSIHLEFGTQNMKARPFMFPALEENKPKIRRMFANIKGKPK